MNRDITILYQGGSGGFALFYYLLLSNKYHTGLPTRDWQSLIDIQFNTELKQWPAHWKHKEFWPDNQTCKKSAGGLKLYLICNPLWNQDMLQQNIQISEHTYKILLYTDFKVQLCMCWHKRAYWFTDVSKKHFAAPCNERQWIRQIIASQQQGLDPQIPDIKAVFKPDQLLNLRDFVKSHSVPGLDPPNQNQRQFLHRWLDLQPSKVQRWFR